MHPYRSPADHRLQFPFPSGWSLQMLLRQYNTDFWAEKHNAYWENYGIKIISQSRNPLRDRQYFRIPPVQDKTASNDQHVVLPVCLIIHISSIIKCITAPFPDVVSRLNRCQTVAMAERFFPTFSTDSGSAMLSIPLS